MSPESAIAFGQHGGLPVLDLEGLWTRYEDPAPLLAEIATLDPARATAADAGDLPRGDPARARHRAAARRSGRPASPSPARSARSAPSSCGRPSSTPASTSSSSAARPSRPSTSPGRAEPLNLKRFIYELDVPVIVGGAASYSAALHLMRTGAAGVLVGLRRRCRAHDPRHARHPRPDGLGHRRRRRRPPRLPRRVRRPLRPRHRRRRGRHERRHRQGGGLRRRRRDARGRAGPGHRRSRARVPLGPRGPPPRAAARRAGRGRAPSPRSRSCSSARAGSPTARPTSSGPCAGRWRRPGYVELKEFQRVEVVVAPYQRAADPGQGPDGPAAGAGLTDRPLSRDGAPGGYSPVMPDVIADPETDPRATYAVDPARVRALAARVVASGEPMTTPHPDDRRAARGRSPPRPPSDVAVAVDRARAAQRRWADGPGRAPRADPAAPPRPRPRPAGRAARPRPARVAARPAAHAFEEVADVAIVARHYARRGPGLPRRPSATSGSSRSSPAAPSTTGPRASSASSRRGTTRSSSPSPTPSRPSSRATPSSCARTRRARSPRSPPSSCSSRPAPRGPRPGRPRPGRPHRPGGRRPRRLRLLHRLDRHRAHGRRGRRAAPRRRQPRARRQEHRLRRGRRRPAPGRPGVLARVLRLGRAALRQRRAARRARGRRRRVRRPLPRRGGGHAALDRPALGRRHGQPRRRRPSSSACPATSTTPCAKGASVLAGGRARPDIGPYVVRADRARPASRPEMACRDEETFGPVVVGLPGRLRRRRPSRSPTTPSTASTPRSGPATSARGRAIAARIDTGTVNINEGYAAAWGSIGAPMGGMKASGLGRRHGREGILKYTESQNVTVAAPRQRRATLPGSRRGDATPRALTAGPARHEGGWALR